MKFDAALAGLTPKSTPTGRVIEIKLVTEFTQATLGGLGELFGRTVTAEIGEQQLGFDFEGQSREGAAG